MNSSLPLQYKTTNIFASKSFMLRPGVQLIASNGVLSQNYANQAQITAPIFELSYNLNDSVYGEVNKKQIVLESGYSNLGFVRQANCHSEYMKGEEVKLLSIWINPDVFNDFCYSVCPNTRLSFSSFQKEDYHLVKFKSDSLETCILHKLDHYLNSTLDSFNLLFIESQILELMSLNLENLIGIKRCEDDTCELTKTDKDSLLLARDILLNRLESPPSLLELSRLIHMNDCKLKRSFKIYFGKTVYEYIREQRLEKAYSLIMNYSYNVTESANSVGYTNVSHFSQAFRNKFGISPGKLVY